MLYFIHNSYVPNVASTNRLLSYLINIHSSINVKVIFLLPDSANSVWRNVPSNIEVFYCWKKYKAPFKLWKYISVRLSLRYIYKLLKTGDVVYCYNVPPFMNYLRKEGVKLYAERTEHPEVTPLSSRLFRHNLKEHLNLCRHLDGLFVISTALREYYINEGVSPQCVHIINMTVDPMRFKDLEKNNIGKKYIAYCGSALNSKDGVDKLIQSFAMVHKKHPEVLLYIIGQAPKSISDSNLVLAKTLGVLENIVFTGQVSASRIPQLLKNASVLALNRPDSLQARCGFATKLGEYLLTENVVVLTDVGDFSLFLKDGISALFSSPLDDKQFAEKLCWALEHPTESAQIGKNGAKVAMSHFNARIEVQKLLSIMGY